ncbi:MAG TPA: type II toxin-antitoxin system VapC family toxin [Candidatus Norongarragalinales archaeon]|nr:type II toxin-antitoxin system VapC family toxin [Candidatus Norongarragalinales archaeon]
MVCLDTDILVGYLRGNPDARRAFESFEFRNTSLCTTVVSACELYEGARLMKDPVSASAGVSQLLTSLEIFGVTLSTAEEFGRWKAHLQRKGQNLEDFDVLIAAIALHHNQELVTRNVRHFNRIPSLRII